MELISVNVHVSSKGGKPCLEIRRFINDTNMIKTIVASAWHDESILILPKFTDKVNSLNSLIKNGVLYKDKNGQYQFTL